MSTVTRMGCVWDEILVTVDDFGAAMWGKCARGEGFGEPITGIKDTTVMELGPQNHIRGGLLGSVSIRVVCMDPLGKRPCGRLADPVTQRPPLTSKCSLRGSSSSLRKPFALEPHAPAVCTVYSALPRSFIKEYTLICIRDPTITESMFLKSLSKEYIL